MIANGIVIRLAARLDRALSPPRARLRPWIVDGYAAGYLDDARAQRIARFHDVFDVTPDSIGFRASIDDRVARSLAMDAVARALAAEGELTRWRSERYAVARAPDEEPLFEIERAAARYFGVATRAAHVNATSLCDGTTRMWIARRSATKAIDPGLLDNLVGGGIAAGMTIADTLVKEAWEEAGIPPDLASSAQPAGRVRIFRQQPDGIHRETIYVHDLTLPPEFAPRGRDDEVADYRQTSIDEVAALIGNEAGEGVFTADASLVIADWLLRHGHISETARAYPVLVAVRNRTDVARRAR